MKRKKSPNCSCSTNSFESSEPWHIPNVLYENSQQRFSIPSPSPTTTDTSSNLFSDATDLINNTFSTIDGEMRQRKNTRKEIVTSTPVGSPVKSTDTADKIISDQELLTLGEAKQSESISFKSNIIENLSFLSNEDLFALAIPKTVHTKATEQSISDGNDSVNNTISTISDVSSVISPDVLEILDQHNLSKDFINLHKSLLDGTISPTDQPILCSGLCAF